MNVGKCQHVDQNCVVRIYVGVALNQVIEKEENTAFTQNINNCLFYGACNLPILLLLLLRVLIIFCTQNKHQKAEIYFILLSLYERKPNHQLPEGSVAIETGINITIWS